MQKHILFLGITLLIGSIYLINQDNESVEVNETLDQTLRFQKFKAKFGKRYGPSEDTYRFAVFTENMMQADIHNAKPESTYTMGETQFADLKKQEFVDIYLRKMNKNTQNKNKFSEDDDYDYPIFSGPKNYPASFDWRKYPGVSTKVKSQGMCGSCWAFSAISEIEAYFAVKKGILNLDLSEQQFVDCLYDGLGCDLNWSLLNQCDKSALSVQPVTVSVISENWYLYTGGVFNYCDHGYPWEIDHIVIAVGYDADSWIIKNSWGTYWGENGYIRLATGNCNNVLEWIYAAI